MTTQLTQARTPISASIPAPALTAEDAIYAAIHVLDGATEKEVLDHASKLCGKQLTISDFNKALESFDYRGTSQAPEKL